MPLIGLAVVLAVGIALGLALAPLVGEAPTDDEGHPDWIPKWALPFR